VNTRTLVIGYPGCRNTETPNSNHAISFRGFAIGISGHVITRDLPLGIPGAETCRNTKLKPRYIISGFRESGFHDCDYKDTCPWVSRVPKRRNTKLNHAIPFRGFASRDFVTCEYKETCPWVSRVPKRRNTKL
jgi:hypothetical protein